MTWDDYGGFYDHVPPVRLDDYGLGIRVPRDDHQPLRARGYVDHTMYEFSSVLRFIEDNWGLTQLTRRDRIADGLGGALDFSGPPRAARAAAAADGLPRRHLGRAGARRRLSGRAEGAATLRGMTTPEPEDEGYLALSRNLYWSQETGARRRPARSRCASRCSSSSRTCAPTSAPRSRSASRTWPRARRRKRRR